MRNPHRILAAGVVLIFVASAKADRVLTISAPDDTFGMSIPVEVGLPRSTKAGDVLEAFSNKGKSESIVLQSAPGLFSSPSGVEMQRTFCTILPSGTGSGELRLRAQPEPKSRFSIVEKNGGRLEVREDDRPIFVYNYGMQLPDGVPGQFRRSTYVHPLYDLKENIVTDDFPVDHYHHRGLSWMWPDVRVEGQTYNLWAIQGIRQVFERWLAREIGPVCATVGVKNAWRIGDRKVADEWVWIRAFPADEYGRAIDFCLTWKALTSYRSPGRRIRARVTVVSAFVLVRDNTP